MAYLVHQHRGDVKTAAALYERALKANPNQPNCVAQYAKLLSSDLNTPEHAERLYRQSLINIPDNSYLLSNWATFLNTVLDKPKEAQSAFEEAVRLSPEAVGILVAYAQFLSTRSLDEGKILEICDRALTLTSDSKILKAINAITYVRVGSEEKITDHELRR